MNQNPGTDGFTSPPKDAARNASSFAGVELSRLQELPCRQQSQPTT